METAIENHTIEYHWRDKRLRHLIRESVEEIRRALERRKKRGRLLQNDGGFWCEGTWKDVTKDDVVLFGFMKGWFD